MQWHRQGRRVMQFLNRPTVDIGDGILGAAIAAIGCESFEADMGLAMFELVGAPHTAVYALDPVEGPTLLMSRSVDGSDVTLNCWEAYQRIIGRRDELWDMLDRSLSPARSSLFAMMEARDIRNRSHRTAVYGRHDLRSRLSFYLRGDDNRLLACNVYRTNNIGGFDDLSIQKWFRTAPALLGACIAHRRIAWRHRTDMPIEDLERRLMALAPNMPRREMQCCAQRLLGRSYKEIARALSISPGTVKIYRERALRRLEIDKLSDLYPRLMTA